MKSGNLLKRVLSRASVLECGSPLPLFTTLAIAVGVELCGHAATHDPAIELSSFQIADGFEANLFASETDGVIKPIQMRFDTRGRLWVIISTVYPQLDPGEKPNDKVLILEDTNNDGRCDVVKTFADGLMIPTGIELTHNGAYIGHGTELLLLRDTDGDDRADERTVVLRGFGTGDNHQNINSFTWGPAGELWMCQGLHTLSNVETPHGLVFLEKAGIWRFRPRLLKLEGFYGSEFEPQNPWGHVFNESNEHIVLAGNNSSPIFPDPGLVPNRRNDAPPLIWPSGNGRKVSGGDFVANPHFPDEWQGRLILGGYINNAVWSARVVDDGAGFRFEDGPPLIRSTQREFRPVDVKFGPDGALYLCDWYNPIIGHYQASFRHPDRDKKHGRIWRVTARNRPLAAKPKIAEATPNELFAHLASTNRWTRQFAKRELAMRPAADFFPALDMWVAKSERTSRELVEALGVYQSHEKVPSDLVRRLTKSNEPQARAYAATAIGLSPKQIAHPLDLLRPLAADPHPRVRLQALIACAQINTPEAIEVAILAADHPFDRFLTYAFNQTVYSLKPLWLPRFHEGALDFQTNANRLAALVRADATSDTLEGLRKLIPTGQVPFLQILADVGNAADLAALLNLGARRLNSSILTTILNRPIKPAGDLPEFLQPLLSSPLSEEAMLLAADWKVEPLLDGIRIAARENSDRAAIAALGRAGPGEVPLLRDLAKSARTKHARATALAQWQQHEPENAAAAASEFLSNEADPITATEILLAFLQRPKSAGALAKALSGKTIPPEISHAALTALSGSGRKNDELLRAFATGGALMKPGDWGQFSKEVQQSGHVDQGAKIYNRAELGCVTCHKVKGAGGTIGPDLSALGTAQPIEFIARAILEPQKEIKEGFTSIAITTKSGDEFQGYILRETKEEILLRDPLPNQEVKIRRDQITSQRANGSLMPAGLVDQLSRDEFRDLVKYLSTLGTP